MPKPTSKSRAKRPHPLQPAMENNGVSRPLLIQATQALGAILSFDRPADVVLSQHFRNNRQLGLRDRRFIAETLYAIVRRLRWLRRLSGEDASARALLLAWLARGEGWPMRNFEGLVSDEERQWISQIKQHGAGATSLPERADMPDWLVSALLQNQDESAVLALAHGLNRPAPLDLRINTLKSDRQTILDALNEAGLGAKPCPYAPQGIRLDGKPSLHQHPLFLDGHFEVQDEGSQLLSHLLQPRRGELVVDFCAGAGGKTLHIGALMHSRGRLYAFDIVQKRLTQLKLRVARAGLSNVHPLLLAHERDARLKRMAAKAERVLVDAPCSSLGTIRRNPDLKWRQTPQTVEAFCLLQTNILDSAARLVRPGGRLVYSTCSLLEMENDAIADAFLATHPDFSTCDVAAIFAQQHIELDTGIRLRLQPHLHNTDGFFAAVFKRNDKT